MNYTEKINEILSSVRPGIGLTGNKRFIDDGMLDSFDMVSLITELNEAFGIEIGVVHMTPENFNSVDSIEKLIKSLE